MKCHVLFESNEHTNGRVTAFSNDLHARGMFAGACLATGDTVTKVEEMEGGFCFLPDDEAESVVMLFLDVEIQS